MVVGIIGIVGACFVGLTARKLGHEVAKGVADLGLSTLAFTLGMVAPTLAAIQGEAGFLVFGAILSATGAFLLYRGTMKMLQH